MLHQKTKFSNPTKFRVSRTDLFLCLPVSSWLLPSFLPSVCLPVCSHRPPPLSSSPSLQTFPTTLRPSLAASTLAALCLPLWSLLSINPQRSVCLLEIRHNASDCQCDACSAATATTKTEGGSGWREEGGWRRGGGGGGEKGLQLHQPDSRLISSLY